MNITFTTKDKSIARDNIVKSLGSCAKKNKWFIDYLIKKVEEGKIRIGDPMMYGGSSPIISTDICSNEDIKEIKDNYSKIKL